MSTRGESERSTPGRRLDMTVGPSILSGLIPVERTDRVTVKLIRLVAIAAASAFALAAATITTTDRARGGEPTAPTADATAAAPLKPGEKAEAGKAYVEQLPPTAQGVVTFKMVPIPAGTVK